jgi:hypothetical protein
MRSAVAIVAGCAVAAVVALAIAALTGEREQAFSLGVARSTSIELRRDHEVCQAPIPVPSGGSFDRVLLSVGTDGRPGPELALTILAVDPDGAASRSGEVLARGTLAAGYPDVDRQPRHAVTVDRVGDDRYISICIANRGRSRAYVFGDVDNAARTSTAFLDGVPAGSDIALDFERSEPRSLASLIPAMVDRAALFRAQWLGTWTYWLLAALVLLGVPVLLAGAVRAASRDGV